MNREWLEVFHDQALQTAEKKLDNMEDMFRKFPPGTNEELEDLEDKSVLEESEKLIKAIQGKENEVDEQIENLLDILNGRSDDDWKR